MELTHKSAHAPRQTPALRGFHQRRPHADGRLFLCHLLTSCAQKNRQERMQALPVLMRPPVGNCLTPVITSEFLVSKPLCGVRSRALNAQHKLCSLFALMSTPYFRDVSACDTLDMNGDVS